VLLAVRNFSLGNLAGGVILALINSLGDGSFLSELVSQFIAVAFESALFFLVLAVYRILLRKRGQFSQQGLAWALGAGAKAFDWAWVAAARMPYLNYFLAPILAGAIFIAVARRLRANTVGN
jgi:hypothetical protein